MRRMSIATAVLLAAACGGDGGEPAAAPPDASVLTLTSPAFDDGETIPVGFTCDGADRSPPLAWAGVPAETVELALLMEDPDAPGGVFVHWVAAGIDPAAGGLGEGESAPVEGRNDFGGTGYRGPCPPAGDDPHRYVVSLYAVDEPLELTADATAAELREAVADTTVAFGQLTGRFGR